MGGQILGGGVIAAVAVLLWIIYLLPSWQSTMRYNAAERNAVRLNQALRVLAETSQIPDEVHVELSAREARAQHRLVRQLRAEEERVRNERHRAELARKRLETEAELERAREEAAIELERRRRELALEAERRRQEAARLREDPELVRVRQARARRRVRMIASIVLLAGIVTSVVGGWMLAAGGTGWWLAGGLALAFVGLQALRRMAAVARRNARARARSAAVATQETRRVVHRAAPVLAEAEERDRAWTPRSLPTPLTSVAGSRAAEVRAQLDAQEALRAAARAEAQRAREEAQRVQEEARRAATARAEVAHAESAPPAPVPITSARGSAERPFAGMGYVDDAEIEAHVRQLLDRRATG